MNASLQLHEIPGTDKNQTLGADVNLNELFEELEQLGEENDATVEHKSLKYLNITRDTGEFLALMVKAGAVKRVLEIGTSNGYSTLWIASALPEGGHVTTLEISPHKIGQANVNFSRSGLNYKITVVQEYASDYVERATHQFDMIFLDADRSSYIRVAEKVLSLIRPGGLLVCDNAVSHAEEMKEFVHFVKNTGQFTTATVPVGKGEFVACKHA